MREAIGTLVFITVPRLIWLRFLREGLSIRLVHGEES